MYLFDEHGRQSLVSELLVHAQEVNLHAGQSLFFVYIYAGGDTSDRGEQLTCNVIISVLCCCKGDISILFYASDIVEYDKKKTGLSNTPLDRSYYNHGKESI